VAKVVHDVLGDSWLLRNSGVEKRIREKMLQSVKTGAFKESVEALSESA
jgi:hypothetical protein